jgi:hypothetical protein
MTPLAGQIPTARGDTEFGDNTPYYEDDAWYDVSEWFDGNDYNPTDEAIGRWDNETFDADENLTSSDNNNTFNWGESNYGYYDGNESADDSWFYDYYDYGYWDNSDHNDDGVWDYTASYYDYDNDGVYDSVSEYFDSDGDGVYEDFNYIRFSESDAEQDQKNKKKSEEEQKSRRSQVVSMQGSIKAVKKVKTPDSTNLVAVLNDTKRGENFIVDLGSVDQYDTMPRLGQELSVEGTTFKAGEKYVLLASKATRDGEQQTINRSGREFTGTVVDMKTMEVRGNVHQLAKIKTDEGKHLLVDMGPQDKLKLDIQKDDSLSVKGPAVKVKDRLMLIAREITSGDKSAEVERVALSQ